MKTKLVILDRDGVINEDSDEYIKSTEEWRVIPGSAQAIASLNSHGFTVAVATNQSGIARGLYNLATLRQIHKKMEKIIGEAGGKIDLIVYCPHGPADQCSCRKPQPGLFRQISEHYGIDLQTVPMVGDSLRDLQAAEAVGGRAILVRTGKGERTVVNGDLTSAIPVYADLAAAVAALIRENN